MPSDQSAILNRCLAYEVLRTPDEWLLIPSPHALEALVQGAQDRARFTGTNVSRWRITGPLDEPSFYLPIVAQTGHPTLSIRWAGALELIHFSMRDALADLRSRLETWASGFDPTSSSSASIPSDGRSLQELLSGLAARPAMYLGRQSASLLYCYLNGLVRGGDWLALPPLPEATQIFRELQEQSIAHYGSHFGAFRVYEGMPSTLLEWVGINPSAKELPNE
jgi:hypothetical protein